MKAVFPRARPILGRSIKGHAWGRDRDVAELGARADGGSSALRRAMSVLGLLALTVLTACLMLDDGDTLPATTVHAVGDADRARSRVIAASSSPAPWSRAGLLAGDIMLGAYGGVSYTHPSTVTIRNPIGANSRGVKSPGAGPTDLAVSGFGWEGQPFKSPVYYGLRTLAWPAGSRWGTLLDFTHAKAIAKPGDVARFDGTLNGQRLAPNAPVRDVFRHLEFSHGHNIVTLNGLLGFGAGLPRLRPYAGLGAGVSLPHTEIGYRGENGRTYEYQYAGVVGQALAGLEVRLGRVSLFFEYKVSYAPYAVPLSGVVTGGVLFTDLWRQFRAWLSGEPPPGGTLRTTLLTHHGIAGALVRVNPVAR